MKIEDVIKKLRVHIAESFNGKQALYAKSMDVSNAHVSAVMTGKKLPTEEMLGHVGVIKVKKIEYRLAVA